ncbi:hypothetical protein [Actinoplanes regularis]|uniref:Uncharacterized protein n=1 Tax=Actinoplanes regularis TaxID=52697 RepID=A0A239JHF8_9ACTN|nr:hypothetical protein [Actinoplanes regularis]GIE92012.1 hypothetical protein Are01nite_84920 [Actinoplanes regularis]SNT05022.1 hypothetical protein SAMN06264365_13532 [Actinoplanes regularis]
MPVTSNSSAGSTEVDALTLTLNRRRRGQWVLFLLGLTLNIPVLVVLAALFLTSALELVYLQAPGLIALLTIPCTVAWYARPTRLPKAEPVLDRAGIGLSAGGRHVRRDVVLPWDRVKFLSIGKRGVSIEPVAWTDLAGDDEAERRRWAKREGRRRNSRWALHYGLAKGGRPSKGQLRDIVADLSGGQVKLR